MEARWTAAFAGTELPEGGSKLFTQDRERVALFRVDGEVFAVDDRCPHEGYPLTQGHVCGTTLTCCFHNFKFDLRDGQCVMGDEAVRTYRTRQRDGVIEVDMTPPDPMADVPRRWASLDEAMRDWRVGQLARDAVRLLAAGVSPVDIAVHAARFDARFGQYGTSHALPVAVDALQWLPRYPGVQAAHPLVQALEIAAEFHVRRPERVVGPVEAPGDPATFAARLAARVEAEDHGAEGLVRGAVQAGWGRDRLEPAVLRLCADHFLDYGHALIYAVKAFDLLEVGEWVGAGEILGSLVHAIVVGTREDVLPAWSGWRKRRDLRAESLAGWAAGTADLNDSSAFEERVLAGGAAAEKAVAEALEAGVSVAALGSALAVTAARRVLRFDAALERDAVVRDNWLSVTHVQTFASAVRHAVGRADGADGVRLLFQAARFIAMTAVLDEPEPSWREDPWLNAQRGLLDADADGLRDEWMDAVIADGSTRGIVVAHGMKQVVAGFDDYRATGRAECALAAIRFAAAFKQERRVARLTREAIGLVVDGKIPRKRVP